MSEYKGLCACVLQEKVKILSERLYFFAWHACACQDGRYFLSSVGCSVIGLTIAQQVNNYKFCFSSMICCGLCAVIQDVENSSLEGQFQSFASLMEQRLAELFVVAHQQGVRFKRATTVGSYTVQVTLSLNLKE